MMTAKQKLLIRSVNALVPNASFNCGGETPEDIDWTDSVARPSNAEIAAKMEELAASDLLVAEQRASEYPSIGDQLDALFHAGVFPAEMAEQIRAIKNKYPKS